MRARGHERNSARGERKWGGEKVGEGRKAGREGIYKPSGLQASEAMGESWRNEEYRPRP